MHAAENANALQEPFFYHRVSLDEKSAEARVILKDPKRISPS
jgi:hypothetical protein